MRRGARDLDQPFDFDFVCLVCFRKLLAFRLLRPRGRGLARGPGFAFGLGLGFGLLGIGFAPTLLSGHEWQRGLDSVS